MKKDYQFYIVTALTALAILFLLSYANFALPSVGQALNVGTRGDLSVSTTCTDSDNGADPTVIGQTKGTLKRTMTIVSVVDYCYDDSKLVEYTCENNYVSTSQIECDCENGICTDISIKETTKAFSKATTIFSYSFSRAP